MEKLNFKELQLRLISHACVQIYGQGFSIICDPWLVGTSFNDGWAMYPEPNLDNVDYEEITHIWISHEHPDHLNFPSMKYWFPILMIYPLLMSILILYFVSDYFNT